MRALLDTNILLDVLMERRPWFIESGAVVDWCSANPGGGWIAWHSLSTLYYLGRRHVGQSLVMQQIETLTNKVDICPVDSRSAQLALALPMKDFEDAMQAAAAQSARLDAVVTRNVSDYKGSVVPAMAPANFLMQVEE
ncbi:MAG: PIN domain-containing protein [Opitutales bacterium]